jgi:hypothetical protein
LLLAVKWRRVPREVRDKEAESFRIATWLGVLFAKTKWNAGEAGEKTWGLVVFFRLTRIAFSLTKAYR